MEIALKIDVDTHDGLKRGVPSLARLLQAEGLTASFYVAMGPDNSGKAIRRVFTNRGFLTKMFRTRAVAMYGWRTILSGTVLPARPIALAFPNLMRDLRGRGFEVGVHGYDHVRWQDEMDTLGEVGVRQELEDALEAYRAVMREPARSFAAPGWRANAISMRLLEGRGLHYHSDTRGRAAYLPMADGAAVIPEIPTTLSTLDEILGRPDLADEKAIVRHYLEQMSEQRLNVHTIHAETEGMGYLRLFEGLIGELKQAGARFVRLDEVAAGLDLNRLPRCPVVRGHLPGRAGWVAMQGEPAPDPSAATARL